MISGGVGDRKTHFFNPFPQTTNLQQTTSKASTLNTENRFKRKIHWIEFKKKWQKEKFLINVFKCHLLQRHQNVSARGKGLTGTDSQLIALYICIWSTEGQSCCVFVWVMRDFYRFPTCQNKTKQTTLKTLRQNYGNSL